MVAFGCMILTFTILLDVAIPSKPLDISMCLFNINSYSLCYATLLLLKSSNVMLMLTDQISEEESILQP